MGKSYFLLLEKKKSGPFTFEELKLQNITEKHMIWNEEMSAWKYVNEVEDVRVLIVKTPILPPPAPFEVVKKYKKYLLKTTLWESLNCFYIIGIGIFVIMGGFSSNYNLKELYPDNGQIPIYADADEIRWVILPFISFGCVALPVSLIFMIFRYKYLISKADNFSK